MSPLREARVLVVGVGGLGSPAAAVLAQAGVGQLRLLDDDRVDESNLHRQVLFETSDVGQPKALRAAERLLALAREAGHRHTRVEAIEQRLLPEDAIARVGGHDLVVEGADNFATKFLAADAAALARVPIVQGGIVRWTGWALAWAPGAGPCLRCLFEDIPRDRVETCAAAGVVGPACGLLGAAMGALALRWLSGDASVAGTRLSLDAWAGRLRVGRPRRRVDCALCAGRIARIDSTRYAAGCAG
ncbi:MAG: HesA/MoeB/ThiF family protein [Myxococcota bacterium]|nr:HesA/MoeB/ThiF family protein [Myxococcota bacterium]MDW8361139.1 HesA/MoeB/ThiF family protein [Myxococcales bacterium]